MRADELGNLVIEVVTEQHTSESEEAGQARGGQENISSLPLTADDGEGMFRLVRKEPDIQLIQLSLVTEKPGVLMEQQ